MRNYHKVQRSQWNSWSREAQGVFNALFIHMRDNQHLYLHPQASPIPKVHWLTTCHNAAWTAANAVDDH